MTEHEPIRLLRELGAELGRVAAQHEARPAGIRARLRGLAPRPGMGARTAALVVAAVTGLSGVAYAMPGTRDMVDDIASSFSGWIAGDESAAPGRALDRTDAPTWLETDDARVIAEDNGVQIVVRRLEDERHGTQLSVSLNGDVPGGATFASSLDGWRERFAADPVAILGTAPLGPKDFADEKGRVPLVGLTAPSVDRVELLYAVGPKLVAPRVDGGVVLMADAARAPREVVAYDAAGEELGRVGVSHIDVRHVCAQEADCAAASD